MTHQFSHTYNRGRELTEAEIYQVGVEHEEKLAELKKAVVNFYRCEDTDEVLAICLACFQAPDLVDYHGHLSYIDKAGDWDECRYCDAQNVPAHYHGEL